MFPRQSVRYHQEGKNMNLKTDYVTLSVNDGTSMRAYVAQPEGRPRAGLLVFQEAFGVNAHIRDVTERFAREGYLSISPELFHRTAPGFEAGYTNFPEVMPHLQALTDPGLAADIQASYSGLKNGGRRTSRWALPDTAWAEEHRSSRLSPCRSVRGVLLRRRHRAGRYVPESGRPLDGLAGSDTPFLGRPGCSHRPGCCTGRYQRTKRGQEGLRKRRVFDRRSWFLLRRSRQLQRRGRKTGWSLTLEF